MKDVSSRAQLAVMGMILMAMTLALDARALWMHRSMSITNYELTVDESVIPWLPSTWSEEEEEEKEGSMNEYTEEDAAEESDVVEAANVAKAEAGEEASETQSEPDMAADSKDETEGEEEGNRAAKDSVPEEPVQEEPVKSTDNSGADSTGRTNLRGAVASTA